MGKKDNHLKVNYNSISRNGDLYIYTNANDSNNKVLSLGVNIQSTIEYSGIYEAYTCGITPYISEEGSEPSGVVSGTVNLGSEKDLFGNIYAFNLKANNINSLHLNVKNYIRGNLYKEYNDFTYYDEGEGELTISSRGSYLDKGMLDIGCSTQVSEDDLKTIFESNTMYDIVSFSFLPITINDRIATALTNDTYSKNKNLNFIPRGNGSYDIIIRDADGFVLVTNTKDRYPFSNASTPQPDISNIPLDFGITDLSTDTLIYGTASTSSVYEKYRLYVGIKDTYIKYINYLYNTHNNLRGNISTVNILGVYNTQVVATLELDQVCVHPISGTDDIYLVYNNRCFLCHPLHYEISNKVLNASLIEEVYFGKGVLSYNDNVNISWQTTDKIENLSRESLLYPVPIDRRSIYVPIPAKSNDTGNAIVALYQKSREQERSSWVIDRWTPFFTNLDDLDTSLAYSYIPQCYKRGLVSCMNFTVENTYGYYYLFPHIKPGKYIFSGGLDTIQPVYNEASPYDQFCFKFINKYATHS